MSVSFGKVSNVTNGLLLHLDLLNSNNYLLNEVEVLVVGGGGGGSENQYDDGAGGGGGGFVQRTTKVSPNSSYTITVGDGGSASGYRGANSSAFGIIAYGGGGGSGHRSSGGQNQYNGASGGGSGGQYSVDTPVVGRAVYGNQGNDGGNSTTYGGGGGGGAGSAGEGAVTYGYGGNGGRGRASSISGTLKYYAAGGGSWGTSARGVGGIGNGGSPGISPTENTGSGGGGGKTTNSSYRATNGAKGIVIIRYPGPQKATGGNSISFSEGYTIHTFTSSGTFQTLGSPGEGSTIYGLQDLSRNRSHMSAISATYSTSDNGNIVFDGTNTYMNGFLNLNTDVTIEFVAKANWAQNNAGNPIPISIDGDVYSSGPNIFYYNDRINWNIGDSGGNPFSNSSVSNLSSSQYYHFVVTNNWLTSSASLYINGSFVGTANALNCTTTGSNKLWIGRWHGGGYRVNMNFGILRIYNRPLTSSEVSQNFNSIQGRFGL